MEPHVQHDSRTKQNIKEALYQHLYEPVQRSFKKRLDALILQNCKIMRYSHQSFAYKGEFYANDQPPFPRKANRLARELYQAMDDYLAELKVLNEQEIPFVMGFITQVLNASNDFHDWLALLPSSLHRPIHEFIAACPCRTQHLTPEEVQAMQAKNSASIDMIKARMVTNLLI